MRILTVILVLLVPAAAALAADAPDGMADKRALATMLEGFLRRVDERAVHDSFWAEELVYTSSSGLRFGKAEIMQGFDDADDSADEDESGRVSYRAEDVQIALYGDTAVVAFRLVAEASGGEAPQYFFNTGTFVRRGDAWKVVAWQATKVGE